MQAKRNWSVERRLARLEAGYYRGQGLAYGFEIGRSVDRPGDWLVYPAHTREMFEDFPAKVAFAEWLCENYLGLCGPHKSLRAARQMLLDALMEFQERALEAHHATSRQAGLDPLDRVVVSIVSKHPRGAEFQTVAHRLFPDVGTHISTPELRERQKEARRLAKRALQRLARRGVLNTWRPPNGKGSYGVIHTSYTVPRGS